MLKYSLFAAAAFLASPVLAQDATTVVATVNGDPITLGEMVAMKSALPAEADQMPDQALWDLLLDQMVRQASMAQSVENDLSPRDVAALAMDRRAYLAGAALERIAEVEPSDADIQAYFDKNIGSVEPQQEYHAAHILLKTEEAAQAVIEELAKGTDFGKLAEERSVGPTGPSKGDLGWFTADRMVKPFADAVAGMEKGETSAAPVKSDFGYHVIQLTDKRMSEPAKLDDVRDQIIALLRREMVEAEISKKVDAAKVERIEGLSPELLRDDSILRSE